MIFLHPRNLAIIALADLTLTGCFDDAAETTLPTHDVEWFKSHDDERKTTLTECSNNPGELKDTPNCSNALEAEQQLSSGSLRNVDW
ncbi:MULTISPECIES: EexN family lipoprotein [unclassified Halomonas]|uniref:EexN family lipoprotein n=1 Tax=unclassified Halomonas TaxID=2609666 RepID=UPI001CF48921|nr:MULTISPECIES: EexN family lipoprotein [unclassified Halomonas]MCA8863500.1 hypothetical protein [Halomonas sp. SBBP1]UZH08819.1 EexN family lipoprotein [Halomonas sp. BDJS001]